MWSLSASSSAWRINSLIRSSSRRRNHLNASCDNMDAARSQSVLVMPPTVMRRVSVYIPVTSSVVAVGRHQDCAFARGRIGDRNADVGAIDDTMVSAIHQGPFDCPAAD